MDVKKAYKFCPRCGFKFSKAENYMKCPSCELHYYLNPKPVVDVALENDMGEFLFSVRAIEPMKGFIDFPGGFIDANENFEEAARRELKEELNIEVGELKYIGTSSDEYLFQNIKYKLIGVSYYAKLPKKAKPRPADDVGDIEFYKLTDVPQERLGWISMHSTLEKLVKYLAENN